MLAPSDRVRRLARALLIVSAILAVWAAAIAVTGGFRLELGSIRISSRNAVRVLLFAVLAAALAWRLAYQEWLEIRLHRWRAVLCRIAAPLVWVMAISVLVVGTRYGVRAAAAADGSGYVSQSALWQKGSLRIDQSYAGSFDWPHAKQTFAPLGYRIGRDDAMVPTYAPGVPLLMAAARMVSHCGPYMVGPVCGALLVLFTFHLGRPMFGTAASMVGAALVAGSPLVLFMALTPMADVPAAAFWTGALAFALRPSSPWSIAAAGICTGIAVLARPNLVPLAIFPWLITVVRADGAAVALKRTGIFALGSVPAALFTAWLNDWLYGSPLVSGYGDLSPGFSSEFAAVNLRQYSAWWWESQGPLAFLFVVALFRGVCRMRRERMVVIGFSATVGLLYLFYQPFSAWWFLRFLLPAVPLVFLLCADAIDWAARGSSTIRITALAAFLLGAGGYALRFADVHDVTGIGTGDQRYVEAALFIDETTPAEAVIVTMQHSGSVRYHAGRLTLRWDWLDPAWLDRAIAALAGRGLPVYLLLEHWEDREFRDRFKGQQTLKVLESPPMAVGRQGELRLYPVASAGTGRSALPAVMPPRARACLDVSPHYVEPPAVRRIRAAANER